MNKAQKEVISAQLKNEEDCLEELKRTYKEALAEIEERIAILKGREDADAQQVIYQVQYQEAVKKQITASLDALQSKEYETISEYLAKAYEDGFLGSLYDMQSQGVPLIFPINQEQVVQAITGETKLSTDLYSALGKDIGILKKEIASEISRGIATNMTYGQIAGNVERRASISRNNALRIARTEGHRISSKASFDACNKAKEKGADVVKKWDATLDGRTRESHRQCDGEVRELDEEFSNGLMYPSDPNGDGSETINCRCVLIQDARWHIGESFTKAVRYDDGTQIVSFKGVEDYEEFKKKYWEEIDRQKQEEKLSKASKSKHAKERMSTRAISEQDIQDALQNPLNIGSVVVDKHGRKSVKYIGKHATVCVNPETGVIATSWKTGTRTLKKFS